MPSSSLRILAFALYIGPDTLMPVASAIAAVVGFLLMFWRRTVALVQRIGHAVLKVFRRR